MRLAELDTAVRCKRGRWGGSRDASRTRSGERSQLEKSVSN